jgi:hypothetical protein
MPDTIPAPDPAAEDATSAGAVTELTLVPLDQTAAAPSSVEPIVPLRVDWEASDSDWTRLRTDRYRRAWRLAALAMGLKPIKDIRRRLLAQGRREEVLRYLLLKVTITNNLTSDDDPDRLSFVKNAENDGRLNDPQVAVIERLVDVVVFVKFALRRGLDIHPRMIAIATEISEASATSKLPIRDSASELAPNDASSSRESLTIGLLMMYLRDLTKRRAAPPSGLLKGVNDDINAQVLAATIHAFVSERVDRDGRSAMLTTGASITTLRKTLGAAKRHFDAISDE